MRARLRPRIFYLVLAALAGALVAAPGSAGAATLKVGAGRADITPPTGYYTFGYVRSDGVGNGQHTRLWARTVVIKQGRHKVALVSADLGVIAGALVVEAAKRLKKRGFSERNILISASHTHGAPTGYFTFGTYNTVFMTFRTPTDFQIAGGFDPTLYEFMVTQITRSIRRADRDLEPGQIGWGKTRLTSVTKNRSLEAHLHNHGISVPFAEGSVSMDPSGPLHTISPVVDVLRVDKTTGGRRVPIGIWATFANHGTVNGFQFTVYNADHHGPASYYSERAIRRAGRVPDGQEVVAVFGNADGGDMSSGLDNRGPAWAEYVGRREARAFTRAWREAGRSMSSRTRLAKRWTRMCFCGQDTAEGPTADSGQYGASQMTGSEENRGPLFDLTRTSQEGMRSPVSLGAQGHKLPGFPVGAPKGAPLLAIRIGDRLIFSVPGEMTAGMGRQLRASLLAKTRRAGVRHTVLSGIANEYTGYFPTPEEFDAQHFEGGSTSFGRNSSLLLADELTKLAGTLAAGKPAPEPYPFDATNGVTPDGSRYPVGAAHGEVIRQPQPAVRRLGRAVFGWHGAPRGLDRPLERPFVLVERRLPGGGWQVVDTDLGLRILWHVDDEGNYTAEWEPPLSTPTGRYRFLVSARLYGLISRPFKLGPATSLVPRRAAAKPGRFAVTLDYPRADADQQTVDPAGDLDADLNWRPAHAGSGGEVEIRVNGKPLAARYESRGRYSVPARPGDRIEIRAGAARDRWGNRNGETFAFVN